MSNDTADQKMLQAIERSALNKSFLNSLNYKSTLSDEEKTELFNKMLEIRNNDDMLLEFFTSLNEVQITYLLGTIDPQDCQYSRSSCVCRKLLQAAKSNFTSNNQ